MASRNNTGFEPQTQAFFSKVGLESTIRIQKEIEEIRHLLDRDGVSYENKKPFLKRLSTDEEIFIDGICSSIGRDQYVVDEYIDNNNSISRMHACIINEEGRWFVQDMNSKNGTYINGGKIQPGRKVVIEDGDILMLSDEEFKVSFR